VPVEMALKIQMDFAEYLIPPEINELLTPENRNKVMEWFLDRYIRKYVKESFNGFAVFVINLVKTVNI